MFHIRTLALLILTATGIGHAAPYAVSEPDYSYESRPDAVPEIDASSASSALGLLAGGLAILYSRKTHKKQ
jgi:hypothetical protein